jgi:hypothetical protein
VSFQIVGASVDTEWTGFFQALPGWTMRDHSYFSGGGCVTIAPGGDTEVSILSNRGNLIHASSMQLRTLRSEQTSKARPSVAPALLNHAALDVPFADQATARLFAKDDEPRFLSRAERHDPSVGHSVVAEHLVAPKGDYLTIRYLPDVTHPRLSHLGFQFQDLGEFDKHCEIVARSGWPIVVGPFEIDGSMVLHFKGPDGMIHDLFHVLN